MNSRWFTRGWTIQELIASSNVRFYSSDWISFGVKAAFSGVFEESVFAQTSLSEKMSDITGIDTVTLTSSLRQRTSISRKVSWAAERKTTRPEDVAYCLLGIFGVNMLLPYGEGYTAFLRLQTEIMRIYDDHCIFAWELNWLEHHNGVFDGILAPHPSAFANSGDAIPCPARKKRTPHE